MDLLINPITTHKNARWFAVIAYLAGVVCMIAARFFDGWVGDVIAISTFIFWYIPVAWCAYKWSQGGNK